MHQTQHTQQMQMLFSFRTVNESAFAEDNVIFIVRFRLSYVHILIHTLCMPLLSSAEVAVWRRQHKKHSKLEQNWDGMKSREKETEEIKKNERSGCKTLQHWIIHQTDFLARPVHSDCFISYSTRNKFSHSVCFAKFLFLSHMALVHTYKFGIVCCFLAWFFICYCRRCRSHHSLHHRRPRLSSNRSSNRVCLHHTRHFACIHPFAAACVHGITNKRRSVFRIVCVYKRMKYKCALHTSLYIYASLASFSAHPYLRSECVRAAFLSIGATEQRFSLYLPDFEKPNGTFHEFQGVSHLVLFNTLSHTRCADARQHFLCNFQREKNRTFGWCVWIKKKPLNLLTTKNCTKQNQSQKYVYIWREHKLTHTQTHALLKPDQNYIFTMCVERVSVWASRNFFMEVFHRCYS